MERTPWLVLPMQKAGYKKYMAIAPVDMEGVE